MNKKAIIYDLDNTVYPVPAIGEKLFKPVFGLIAQSGEHHDDMDAIKKDMMKIPFRVVADKYNFSQELIEEGIKIQEDIEFTEPIETFADYSIIKTLPGNRFLVTTGFRKMQQSKIKQMGIEQDFTEIHIVDPTITSKKEVFDEIMERYGYSPEDVLVVGDDPGSEIKAAKELNIETVLYDHSRLQDKKISDYYITSYTELKNIFTQHS